MTHASPVGLPVALVRRLGSGIVLQLLGRVFGLVVTLLSIRIVARYLGVERFGDFSMVTDMAALLVIVSEIGVTTILSRELAKAPEQANPLGAVLLAFRIAATFTVVAVSMAVVPLLPYDPKIRDGFFVGFAAAFVGSLASFPNAFFQVNMRFGYLAAIDLVARVLLLVLLALGATHGDSFVLLVGAVLVANVVRLGLAFYLSRRFWRIAVEFDWGRAKPLVLDSLLVGAVTLLGLLHFKGDVLLISIIRGPRELGIYAVAYRFIEQAFFIPALVAATAYPVLTRMVAKGDERAKALIVRVFELLLALALVTSLFLFIFAPTLVRIVTDSSFANAALPLRILSASLGFVFGAAIFTNVLLALNRRRELIVVPIVALLVNLALNVYFVKVFGYVGAATTTFVTEALSFGVTLFYARRACRFEFDASTLRRLFLVWAAAWATALATLRDGELASAASTALALALAAVVLGLIRPSKLRAAFASLGSERLEASAPSAG